MDELVGQSKLLDDKPVVLNVLNVRKPAPGEPALLTFDEATTMFHEMGHAVHGLLSNATYPSLAGTSVPRDYVEFPSQFEEDWLLDPKVLGNVARHHQTGEPIPKPLLDKLLASRKFNQGFESFEYLAAALLDMVAPIGRRRRRCRRVQAAALATVSLSGRRAAGRHIRACSRVVSAGYYAYLWTRCFADAFAFMATQGGFTRRTGIFASDLAEQHGRAHAAAVGYRGRPTVDALLNGAAIVKPKTARAAMFESVAFDDVAQGDAER
jgi:peptidyl-dipeptidase Dcp